MSLLGLIPWYWRLGAIAALALAVYGTGWIKGREGEAEKFEAYKGQVKLAGDEQNALAQRQSATWKQLVEATERDARLRNDDLAAQLAAARLRNAALAGRRLVPANPGASAGDSRICYAREQLDRGLREALGRLYERVTALAEQGQRDRDIAVACTAYVKALAGK